MNKKVIVNVLKVVAPVLITVAALCKLFWNRQQDMTMLDALIHADKGWICAAIASYGVVEIFAVTRWQILLRVQGVKISWPRLSALLMIGLFFNPFMPGGTGGDVVKIFYVLKEAGEKKAAALLAVLMDRLIGLLGVIIIAGIVITLRYDYLTQTKVTSGLLYTLLAIFAGSFAFILVSIAITAFGLVHKLPQKMPLREKLVELSIAYTMYGQAWRATLLALFLAFPVHIGSFSVFYFAFRAFPTGQTGTSMLDFWAIMPIVNTIAAVPISVGGTGVREGLFVHLLGDLCHIPASMAVIISLTGFMVQILWGLVGGVIYLFYRPSNPEDPTHPTAHAGLGQIEREVAALEHDIAETEGQGA